MSDEAGQVNGTGQATAGQAVVQPGMSAASPTAASPATAAAATRRAPAKRVTRRTNGHAASTNGTTPANSRTIAITIPNDVADWYDQQASQAPFEPSTQRYVAWQLREWMKQAQASQAKQQQKSPEQQLREIDDPPQP